MLRRFFGGYYRRVIGCSPSVPIVCAIGFGPFDDEIGDTLGDGQTPISVNAEMDACPNARICRILRSSQNGLAITWEQIGQYMCRCARIARMGRGITGMGRNWEERRDGRVKLRRSGQPIGVFGVKTGDERIIACYTHERVDARRTRRIGVQLFFKDMPAGPVKKDGATVIRLPVHGAHRTWHCMCEVLDLRQFGQQLGRVESWRRIKPHLVPALQDPCLPSAHQRKPYYVAAPHARSCRNCTRPLRIGAIGLGSLDYLRRHSATQGEARFDIAGKADTGQTARLGGRLRQVV